MTTYFNMLAIAILAPVCVVLYVIDKGLLGWVKVK